MIQNNFSTSSSSDSIWGKCNKPISSEEALRIAQETHHELKEILEVSKETVRMVEERDKIIFERDDLIAMQAREIRNLRDQVDVSIFVLIARRTSNAVKGVFVFFFQILMLIGRKIREYAIQCYEYLAETVVKIKRAIYPTAQWWGHPVSHEEKERRLNQLEAFHLVAQ